MPADALSRVFASLSDLIRSGGVRPHGYEKLDQLLCKER
jgi:hypothetical protein